MASFQGWKSSCSPKKSPTAEKQNSGLITHIWSNYVPNTFIEPHPYLIQKTYYDSVNLVSNLWNNGRDIGPNTFWMKTRNSKNLVQPSFFFRAINRITRWLEWSRFNRFCSNQINRDKISLVHSHFGTTACEMNSFLKKVNRPHVVTIYGYDGSGAITKKSVVKKYRRLFKTISIMVVLCEKVKQRMIALGCDPAKIRIWNMPAGIENYSYKARSHEQSKTTRFIMAARFAEAKGHLYLLEAFSKILKKGHDCRLTLLGYGHHYEIIKKKIFDLNLDSNVTLINNELSGDFSTQYNALLNTHDIFVLPSIQAQDGTDESGPSLTLVCAQAAGLPVICTPFPGAEISVIHNKTGLICNEKDSDSLAAQMEYLIVNRNVWNSLGREASDLVQKQFSEKAQMDKLMKIYEEAMTHAG